ncbi:alpha/beta hydrolase [Demequina mangrovi]|uniref:Lysophospholipase, alpha-beta hydrolase superfamily n=1 Tax=Demequina mangrovi TaxID=1043493 RepID=A0A1H6U0I1_9MICO|nr:alpha/beta hydrolase [Demequina mangrovi]SEI81482.1 Lysophospholipase, alpha-beta hydrolase superfamily [Demequina mangrovi]
MTTAVTWDDDVLAGYAARPLGDATLVRALDAPASPRAAVLHVHGYNDYFFQDELARFLTGQGLAFYAVDMRRAGRSLRDGDVPHLISDIAELGDDIGAAAAAVEAEHPGLPLIVHAHSNGGLAAAIWASDRPSPALAGLVLDSPYFDRVGRWSERVALRAVPALAGVRPAMVLHNAPSHYAAYLLAEDGGGWSFDAGWKTPAGVPVRAAWLAAVRAAQARVAEGLDIRVPVLVGRSHSSGPDSPDNPLLGAQDTVVDVGAIARLAPRLGPRVTETVITGGVHELSLSSPVPRAAYLAAVAAWLTEVLA